ncbi:cohesin domain-containing protein [Candidatus Eisenbacteria bacterium]|uniref:Cohesin domain-containing protein n=1 Tax=Eiseniibacteriota bacterium TaxID=2212470 RepID=A0ABV6YKI0_UNCEI
MSMRRVQTLCVLLAVGIWGVLAPSVASAADAYEVVVEYNGPYFHVVNAAGINQLVDDPLTLAHFTNPYGVAVSIAADGRIMNYVLDSGNKRIRGFESNMDVARFDEGSATWAGGGAAAAGEYDDDEIFLPQWMALATIDTWLIPYSEVVRIDGDSWRWVASLTGFTAADKVYTIDYDKASGGGPLITFPASSLTATSTFELTYAISDYKGGGTAAFGLGDIDSDCANGASIVEVLIDEIAPSAVSLQDMRSLFTIPLEGTATSDEIWVVDASDNSSSSNEYLQVYSVTDAGVEAALESYDDLLNQPSDVYVAGTGAGYTVSTFPASTNSYWTAQAVADANQITGHSYLVEVNASDQFTVTDLTTGRVMVSLVDAVDMVAANNYIFPGAAVTWDNTWAAGAATSEVVSTARAIHDRYAFVCDRGNDRIKILASAHAAAATGDDMPGDAHTCVVQPTGAASVGLTADEDYYFSTPSTVPRGWRTGTVTRAVKENTITVVEDPAGTPVTWTRVDDLSLAGPTNKVYMFDWWEGVITFGDGIHGQMPSASTTYSCTYTSTPDVLRYGSRGSGKGQFSTPSGVCARWSSNLGVFVIYVADTGNNRIQKFHFTPEDPALGTVPRMEFICEWNTASTASDYLSGPTDVDIETDGTDYFVAVADYQNNRVVLYEDTKFNSFAVTTPAYETAVGSMGNTLGTYNSIGAIDLVKNATELEIYVSDADRGTVTKYVKAPAPTITLYFTTGSASELPMSFPPTSAYTYTYTTANAPEGAWVDLYYDTAATFSQTTAKLCVLYGTTTTADSPLRWTFSGSPDGTPGDGTYYLYAILRDASGNAIATDQTTATELLTIDRSLLPAAQIRDHFDNDPTELAAPNEEQTISLEMSYPDSVIGISFVGTFPADILQIDGVSWGNGWLGTDYDEHVGYFTYDNTAGTYAVFSSVTGAPNGLTGTGSFEIAKVHVTAKDALDSETRFKSGTFALDATQSGLKNIHGADLQDWGTKDMAVKLAYVGDIASSTNPTFTDSTPPYQQPDPDGYMNFADQMALTRGWNGAQVGGTFMRDPIADMGPVVGTEPKLVPTRDGSYDVGDLQAFTRNWSWYGTNAAISPQLSGPHPGTGFTPLGSAVKNETGISLETVSGQGLPGEHIQVDVQVSRAHQLTGAMVRVAYDPAELTLVSTERGEMFAREGGNVLFNTIRREGVCELCVSRLSTKQPGVNGDGTIAHLTFRVTGALENGLTCAYDLRDRDNTALARGQSRFELFGAGVTESVVLCQNYPNPLSPTTSIAFALPTKQAVDLAIYDLNGRRIQTLLSGPQDAGAHTVEWNGEDANGADVPSGVYFYKLRTDEGTHHRKLIVTN